MSQSCKLSDDIDQTITVDLFAEKLSHFTDEYARLVSRCSKWFIVLPVVFTCFCATGIIKIQFENNVEVLYTPTNAPSKIEHFKRYQYRQIEDQNQKKTLQFVRKTDPKSRKWYDDIRRETLLVSLP